MNFSKYLLLVSVAVHIVKSFKYEKLENFQGITFREINPMKLVLAYKTLPLHISVKTDIDEPIEAMRKRLEDIKKICDSPVQKNDIDIYSDELNVLKLNIHDMIANFESGVSKRKLSFSFADFIDSVNPFKSEKDENFLKIARLQIAQNCMLAVADEKTRIEEVKRKINGIVDMIRFKNLDANVVALETFNSTLVKISRNLSDSEALPYTNILDYYKLGLKVTTKGDLVVFDLTLPVVQKDPLKFYEVIQIPTKTSDDKMIRTKLKISHVAVTSTSLIQYKNLNSCTAFSDQFYVCNGQNTLSREDTKSCIVQAYRTRYIDENLCNDAIEEIKLTHLIFVPLHKNELYWLYSPRSEKMKSDCNGEIEEKDISGCGTIEITPGCQITVGTQSVFHEGRGASASPILAKSFEEAIKRSSQTEDVSQTAGEMESYLARMESGTFWILIIVLLALIVFVIYRRRSNDVHVKFHKLENV